MVRQLANETNRVFEQIDATLAELNATHRRVECREQLVLNVHTRACQRIEQRRLTYVGVTD